ncbi:MAG TPA: hypothetical protein VII38_02860, partial [Polyangia bacterium]
MSYGIRPLSIALALAIFSLAGCGAAMNAPGKDGAVPTDGGAPTGDAALADGNLPGDAGPSVTTIRIHYPAGTHTLALRGDTAPLDWNMGVTLTADASGVFSYRFAANPA